MTVVQCSKVGVGVALGGRAASAAGMNTGQVRWAGRDTQIQRYVVLMMIYSIARLTQKNLGKTGSLHNK